LSNEKKVEGIAMNEYEPIENFNLLLEDDLSIIAREIYQTIFDNGEMSLLETKVDDRLLESVHRVIHRMEEDVPGNIRQAEGNLLHINDPYLAVAILQKAFLIRKDFVLESITRQLNRLLYSQNKKTSELTLLALEEAINSEILRLQTISCHALFDYEKLPDSKLLAFSGMETLYFEYRIESVNKMIYRASKLAAYGFTKLLEFYDQKKNRDEYKNYTKPLEKTANNFKNLSNLDRDDQMEIVKTLFVFADWREIDRKTKKYAQLAMAQLSPTTIQYFNGLSLQEKSNPTVIFTLGYCIYTNPLAVKALIDIGIELTEEYGERKDRALNLISQQLKRAHQEKYLDELQEFELAVSTLDVKYFPELSQTLENLTIVNKQWRTGQKQRSLEKTLSEIEEYWVKWQKFENKYDAPNVRYNFEKEIKRGKIRFTQLSEIRRTIIIAAMEETAESEPWINSRKHLINCFNSLESYEQLVVIDVLGYVALIEKGIVENRSFNELEKFFMDLRKSSNEGLAQKASQWVPKLKGEVLPE
jgi:hypothetical protein